MAIGRGRGVGRALKTVYQVGAVRELTDGQLLERFVTGHGEPAELAFAVIVERHGPMVLRVCRAVLPGLHDAHDAFQATFLVLVRKARALWVRDSLGPWLHQVAYRTASGAQTADARRRRLERGAARPEQTRDRTDRDLAGALHEEVEWLPERFRAPVVLCDLEGRTHDQAARHLGWPVGTVKSRLTRARERLRERLRRRGHGPDAPVVATATAVPVALADGTARASVQFLAAKSAIVAPAAFLARGVLRVMFITQLFKVGTVLVALGGMASGVGLVARQGQEGEGVERRNEPIAPRRVGVKTAVVKRGPLRSVLQLRGSLEAVECEAVHSPVEGEVTILSLVPEGSKVNKGDVVGELDSAALKDRLINQVVATKGAEAAFRQARRAREVAEVTAAEYAEGIYPRELQNVKGEIALAHSDIRRAEDRVEWSRKMHEKGFVSLVQYQTEQLALQKARFLLEQAESKKAVLERYTRVKQIESLQGEVEKARADERAGEAAWELAKAREEELRRQIEACKLVAPIDGVAVYAGGPKAGGPAIEENVVVRERQLILNVVNVNGPMEVNCKAPEATVDRIKTGQKVPVKIDAFPGATLSGTVKDVAPRPDPRSFFERGVKVYTTRVTIDDRLSGLRPGMTALVEVALDEREVVLTMPGKAVVRHDGKDFVAVTRPDGSIDWRPVTLGKSFGDAVEIRGGLREGEVLSLDPFDAGGEGWDPRPR